MLTGILGSRGFMSAAVVLTLVLAGGAALHLARPTPEVRSYCADMPDSIGLYRGSPVTVLGLRVGEVTGIEPEGPWARVHFTVRADRKLPLDVGAVTVNDTLVADRDLALVGDEPTGPGWDSGTCITNTLTPASLTETFDALAGLADELDSTTDDPATSSGLAALNRATAGTGDQLNAVITQLGQALSAPDAAIGHIGSLIDALAALLQQAHSGWDEVEAMTTELPRTFNDIVTIAFPPIIDIVTYLIQVLPQLNDAMMLLATPTVRALDKMSDLPDLLAAGVGSFADIVERAPAIAAGLATSLDPATGRPTVDYLAPKIALPQGDSATLCAALHALTGQPCTTAADGSTTVPSIPLLLAAVSAG
ncbi:MlaD family protein [Nocardia sp. NPDC059177]|uniref:MlaD family protein n=1 Tax=Nocardia sp. NPDC059177 TaxID=3346759 RepID=UPI0036C76151